MKQESFLFMHNNQITTSKIKEEDYQFQTQGKIQEVPTSSSNNPRQPV